MLFMDEHDPRFDPLLEDLMPHDWGSFLYGIGRAVLLALAAAGVATFLGGCDDIERQVAAAEYKDRFFNGCLPRKGDTVTAQWVNGKLICQRTTTTGRYGPTFPHTENRIAIVEPM